MIRFNRPFMTGTELSSIAQAHQNGHLSGDGPFTKECHAWLREKTNAKAALLTHSCTAALEMAALLLRLEPGDEVIMPSFTFVSTASAFALRGAVPVFVDVREDTLNIDESLIEQAITEKTKAICVVHYAGVSCEMDEIMATARRHGLRVVEDAAQGIMSSYRGRPLGSIGDLGAFSFHETKNIISGEGGALLCRDDEFGEAAEIIREKGTNRSRFFRGQVDKYTWVDVGSSYLPGEITAAFLSAQMQQAEQITQRRLAIWDQYHAWAQQHEQAGRLRRPVIPPHCTHNAHMYYMLLPSLEARTHFIATLREQGVQAVFHYIPLHSSPAGQAIGRTGSSMAVTDDISDRLVRMPLWLGVEDHLPAIFAAADQALAGR
ncbi:DegT/DnrJ/EryC1/StrS aminotransferase [Stenotrophomonas sp. SKA14]|uniref:dTDP-4-amino-4,6-dideoxygalactose transaminase n=1 Tax=Stenotrophomonas TaxID=40323 RepID=UPI00018FF369|nr:dTDP-4-amino-4,6-dideoxygalactose transaminase [Stenotrophomonas sp. SKA14]EED39224.1 DegT/DnrJ/EryC1/StrS aminotransferase [Stenotrophomonas sp. SKA14]